MKTFVFPGQGSQSVGMGGSLFDKYDEMIRMADNILDYSIKELCLNDPNNKLNNTAFTQPALYIVNCLSYLDKIESGSKKPEFVAGHSLGEYSALFAAGAVNFETGLKIVIKRGELMSSVSGGAMAAIIGINANRVGEIICENNLEMIDIANYNAPSQTVISGLKEDVEKAKTCFKKAKARFIPLKVSGAFHSRYMLDVQKHFNEFLKEYTFSDLTIPLISNVQAQPYKNGEIMKNLTDQLSHSVQWIESIKYLLSHSEMKFEEIGPGKVLTGLVNKIIHSV